MAITVGVVGLGRIGAQWDFIDPLRQKPASHVGAWAAIPEVEWIVVHDTDQTKVADLYKHFREIVPHEKHITALPTYKELAKTCDIVSVATPPETHAQIVCELASAHDKLKLVWCEKPIALKIADAEVMVRACKENGVKLAVNHTRRWHPIYSAVAGIIKSATFGAVLHATAYYSGDPFNTGVHMADLLNWYGISDELYSSANFGGTWSDFLLFELDVFLREARIKILDNGERYELYTSQPSIRYDHVNELAWRGTVHEDYLLPWINGARATPMVLACLQLVECMGKDKQPNCTGKDGLQALERVFEWAKEP